MNIVVVVVRGVVVGVVVVVVVVATVVVVLVVSTRQSEVGVLVPLHVQHEHRPVTCGLKFSISSQVLKPCLISRA